MVAPAPARLVHPPRACAIDDALRGCVAVIGNMDGVHRGHAALLQAGREVAEDAGKPFAAIVFDPHPRRAFNPDTPPFLLTDLAQKAALLANHGVEIVFALPFEPELYKQTPPAFVLSTLRDRLGVSAIITGTDFRFGAGRAGTIDALRDLAEAEGIAAHTITPVVDEDAAEEALKFSSSSARQALRDGDPAAAARILGRPFRIRGTVFKGRKLARTLDFPTANVTLGEYVRPRYGVYVVLVDTPDGQFPGVANIGVRPTVDGETECLEAHIFDRNLSLYGTTIEVSLLHFLRPEQPFSGLDALKAQIAQDAAAAREKAADVAFVSSLFYPPDAR